MRRGRRTRWHRPFVVPVGAADDDALVESVIGLFETEPIEPQGPWRTVEQVEILSLERVG